VAWWRTIGPEGDEVNLVIEKSLYSRKINDGYEVRMGGRALDTLVGRKDRTLSTPSKLGTVLSYVTENLK